MKAFFSYSNSCDVVSTAYLHRFHDNPSTAIAHFLVGLQFTMTQTSGEKKGQFSGSEEKKYPQNSQHQNMVVGSILTQTRNQTKAATFSIVKRRSQLQQEPSKTNHSWEPTRLFLRRSRELCARLASFCRLLYFLAFHWFRKTVLFFLDWKVCLFSKESPIGNYRKKSSLECSIMNMKKSTLHLYFSQGPGPGPLVGNNHEKIEKIYQQKRQHNPHPRTFTVISRRDLSLKSEFKQSNLPSFSTFIAYSGAGNKTKRLDQLPRLAIGLYSLTIN